MPLLALAPLAELAANGVFIAGTIFGVKLTLYIVRELRSQFSDTTHKRHR